MKNARDAVSMKKFF